MQCIAITEDVISARVSDGLSKHRLREGGGRAKAAGSMLRPVLTNISAAGHWIAELFSLQVQSCCENLAIKKRLSSGTAMSEITPPPFSSSVSIVVDKHNL